MRDQPWEKHIAENRVNQQVQRVRRVIKKVMMRRAAAVRGLGAKGGQSAAVKMALDDRAMMKKVAE